MTPVKAGARFSSYPAYGAMRPVAADGEEGESKMSDQPELAVSPDKVCFLIGRAREFHAKEEVVIPEEPTGSAEDWARQVLADHRDDPSYRELHELIDAMDVEEQINLVALMWLGRGDFSTAEWSEALQEAGERLSAHTADYIISTPLVANYLEEGLSALGYTCEGITE